ncbi:MAG: hypothetical protein ACRDRJ_11400 [Streptosporangiaceae bacterium]
MNSIRGKRPNRRQARVGAPDRALMANAGLAAVTELCERLRVIESVDAAAGPVKQRDRGFSAGELLAGIAAAQLTGDDFLAGPDRQRADVTGRMLGLLSPERTAALAEGPVTIDLDATDVEA